MLASMNVEELDSYLNPGRAAAFLGISRGHLAYLGTKGRGPARVQLPGGAYRYRISALRAWLNDNDTGSPPPGPPAEPQEVAEGGAL